jgi:protein O-mannosyl-transferase
VAFAAGTIILLAFSNSFQVGFALDNKGLLLEDPRIRAATSENVQLIFQHTYWWPSGESGLYRPLTTMSYLFDYAILGSEDHPAAYHWMNLGLHFTNIVLLSILVTLFLRSLWPSVFVVALWAVHPALTESVTNIIGRADLLSAAAVFGSLLLYIKSRELTGWPRAVCLTGLMIVTAVGVFSKESAVVIPAVIVLYEVTYWKDLASGVRALWGCLAALVPIAAMLYQRSSVLAASPPAEFPFTDNPIIGASFWAGKLTAIKIMADYLWMTVWPVKLSSDYSYSAIPLTTGSVTDWIAWSSVAACCVGVLALYRYNRAAFFFGCFAFLTFLPVANLLFPIGAMRADRFLYLPSAGLLACLVLGVYSIGRRFRTRAFAPLVLSLAVLGLVVRTCARNSDWNNDLSLASADVGASPNSFKIHRRLALALFDSDQSHANIDQVIDEAEKALAILDPLTDSRNAANAYLEAGSDYLVKGSQANAPAERTRAGKRALQILLRCISIDKAHVRERDSGVHVAAASEPEAYRLMSVAYVQIGDHARALDAAIEARALRPFNPEVYRQLAAVFLESGRGDDAAVALMEGMLVTEDPGLRQELIDLYRTGLEPGNCAIMPGPQGSAINSKCEMVRRQICAASVDAIRVRIEAGQQELAESQRTMLAREYGCPSGPAGH